MHAHNYAIIINFRLSASSVRSISVLQSRRTSSTAVILSIYRERVLVHGVVRDTLKNLFVRMIDERKCLVHFSY